MNKRLRQKLLTALAIVAGCATVGQNAAFAQAVDCPGASCDVIVTMTGDPAATTVTVSANELKMKKGTRDAVITWKLQAPNYEFRADSIKPHTGAPVGNKQTTSDTAWSDQCTRLNTAGDAIRIRNRNTKAGPLFYDVKVYHKTNGRSFVLDPAIVNDP